MYKLEQHIYSSKSNKPRKEINEQENEHLFEWKKKTENRKQYTA